MRNTIANLFLIIGIALAITSFGYLVLHIPAEILTGFSFGIGFFIFNRYGLKKRQIAFLIDRIAEHLTIKIDKVFAVEGKSEEEKETMAQEIVDKEPLIGSFNNIFGVPGDKDSFDAIVIAIVGDVYCFDIKKYVKDEKKFNYYYNSEYLD